MKKRTWIIIVILALIGGGVFAYLKFNKADDELQLKTSKLEKGNVTISVSATGKVSAVSTVLVGTQVSGTISKIYVDFNSNVKAGQVIAELDKTYLLASVEDARAAMERSRIQMEQLKRVYDRNKKLFDEKVLSQMEFEQSESDYQTAVTNHRSSEALYNRAMINLNYATIKAPISGVVTSRSVDVGQTVAASYSTPTLFTIANDLTQMQVQASIDEADIGAVREGQEVRFSVDAYVGQYFKGKVRQIRLEPVNTNNVVTYTVIIDFSNPDKKILPGMTANINVIIKEKTEVYNVPVNAFSFRPTPEMIEQYQIQFPDSLKNKKGKGGKEGKDGKEGRTQKTFAAVPAEGSHRIIWVKNHNSIRAVKVTIGINDGNNVEVTGDIKEEDEVITGIQSANETTAAGGTQNPFVPNMNRNKTPRRF